MGVSSGRTRVADMAFQIFARSIHPDWFTVRVHKRFAQAGWEADVRIIEGGHAISWSAGRVRLTEVLAGPETALPEAGRMFQSILRHDRSASLRPGGGCEYHACFEVERIDPEVFAHLNDELAFDATRGDLFHRFAAANRLAPSPLGRLHVEARPRGLLVQAFHTFPDERAIVRTQSLFEIGTQPPR